MTATEIVTVVTGVSIVLGLFWNARKERRDGISQAVRDALAPANAWRDMIGPMDHRLAVLEKEASANRIEIGGLRERVTLLEGYVTVLQTQIRDLGAEPIPFEHVRTKIVRPNSDHMHDSQ